MAPFKALLLFIITFFILAGCDFEENSDDAEATITEGERSLGPEQAVIEVSVTSNEFNSEINIELPNNFRSAMSDLGEFESVVVTRDMNNSVEKRSLVFDDDNSDLIESILLETTSLNGISLHFYDSESGDPVADCLAMSQFPSTRFSCTLRILENIQGHYAESTVGQEQYVNITITSSDEVKLEGAVIASECYGPLAILDNTLGEGEASISTFIPNYYAGALEVYKGGQHVYLMGGDYSEGTTNYSFSFPDGENSKALKPSNGYTAQMLELYGPEQKTQTIIIPEFQSARKSAEAINSYDGISASAKTEVRMAVYNPEGRLSINLSGQTFQYIDQETLVQDINELPEFSLTASLDQDGYLIFVDEKGDDITIEICSSYAVNQLTIWGDAHAGPVVIGSSHTADRIVTVGGNVSWQEDEGYELDVPYISFLVFQAGDPNTDLPWY
jgi:hypothetical protein